VNEPSRPALDGPFRGLHHTADLPYPETVRRRHLSVSVATETLAFDADGNPEGFTFGTGQNLSTVQAFRVSNNSPWIVVLQFGTISGSQFVLNPGEVNVWAYTQNQGNLVFAFPSASGAPQTGAIMIETSDVGLEDFPGSYPSSIAITTVTVSGGTVSITGPTDVSVVNSPTVSVSGGTVEVSNPLTISGTVDVSGSVEVSNDVSATVTGAVSITDPITIAAGTVTVDNELSVTVASGNVDISTGNITVQNPAGSGGVNAAPLTGSVAFASFAAGTTTLIGAFGAERLMIGLISIFNSNADASVVQIKDGLTPILTVNLAVNATSVPVVADHLTGAGNNVEVYVQAGSGVQVSVCYTVAS
jgi:hypothetical protein